MTNTMHTGHDAEIAALDAADAEIAAMTPEQRLAYCWRRDEGGAALLGERTVSILVQASIPTTCISHRGDRMTPGWVKGSQTLYHDHVVGVPDEVSDDRVAEMHRAVVVQGTHRVTYRALVRAYEGGCLITRLTSAV